MSVKDAANRKELDKQRQQMSNPIFSSKPGTWQMDTVFPNSEDKYFKANSQLWFQNVNTKKIHTIPIDGKGGSLEIKKGLKEFKKWAAEHNQPFNCITADKDGAYQEPLMLDWFNKNKIKFQGNTNHSTLGVLNRGVKTIRKQVKNTMGATTERLFNTKNITKKVNAYNSKKAAFLEGHSPNEMANDEDLELSYIAGKMNESDRRREKAWQNINLGDEVRRFDLRPQWKHGEPNLYKQKYRIYGMDKLRGQVWLGPADRQLAGRYGFVKVPRYQIIKNKNLTSGNNFDPDDPKEFKKRVSEITGDDGGENYNVKYIDGSTGTQTWRQLRGNRPMNPLRMEVDYLVKKNKAKLDKQKGIRSSRADVFNRMPEYARKYIPEDFKQKTRAELADK